MNGLCLQIKRTWPDLKASDAPTWPCIKYCIHGAFQHFSFEKASLLKEHIATLALLSRLHYYRKKEIINNV